MFFFDLFVSLLATPPLAKKASTHRPKRDKKPNERGAHCIPISVHNQSAHLAPAVGVQPVSHARAPTARARLCAWPGQWRAHTAQWRAHTAQWPRTTGSTTRGFTTIRSRTRVHTQNRVTRPRGIESAKRAGRMLPTQSQAHTNTCPHTQSAAQHQEARHRIRESLQFRQRKRPNRRLFTQRKLPPRLRKPDPRRSTSVTRRSKHRARSSMKSPPPTHSLGVSGFTTRPGDAPAHSNPPND